MKKLVYSLFAVALVFACQKKSVEETQATQSFEAEKNAFAAYLKTASEAAARLQATGAEFNAALMHDPSKATSYANHPVKAAANLGIYLADLNYSVAYQQGANTQQLFDAAYSLSKAIGVDQQVLDFLMQRFSANIQQNDSVKAVLVDLFARSTGNLEDAERERLVGIAMSAYQIENLHLALGLIETYPKDMLPEDARTQILVPVYRMVLDQKGNVQTIANFLKANADPLDADKNPNYPYYANALQELIQVYDRLNIEDKLANNQGLELMNDAVAAELSQKVKAIRDKVVSQ
jgi:hypothetical protein